MRLIPYVSRFDVPGRFIPDASRILEDFFSDFPTISAPARSRESWTPAVDILEKKGELILRAELPGFNEKDIDLKLEGRVLAIKGERKRDTEENRMNYHRVESVYGTFSRSFALPDTVETDKIRAEYKNGILTVSLPQKPEVRPREIPVSVS